MTNTKAELLSVDKFALQRYGRIARFSNKLQCMRMRVPYLIEDWTGVNMNYYCSINMPFNLITSEERRHVKEGEVEDLKKKIYNGLIMLDDPIDVYSKHTLLHDAVIMNR